MPWLLNLALRPQNLVYGIDSRRGLSVESGAEDSWGHTRGLAWLYLHSV